MKDLALCTPEERNTLLETFQHIYKVRARLHHFAAHLRKSLNAHFFPGDVASAFARILEQRGAVHDHSKLNDPELSIFAKQTHLLAGVPYGSDEYKELLKGLGPALDHHYAHNSHHPEHYPNGIDDMDLFDLIEMFCDWWAATERHESGDIMKSIDVNQERFNMDPRLADIFRRTVDRWNEPPRTPGIAAPSLFDLLSTILFGLNILGWKHWIASPLPDVCAQTKPE